MKETLEKIFNALVFPIYWKNKEGTYIGCNPCFANLLGLKSTNEIKGKQDVELFEKDFALKNQEKDMEALSSKNLVTFETKIKLLNQKSAFYLIKKIPLSNVNNESEILFSVWIDVYKYKKTEFSLLNELDQLEQIIALMPGHAYWLDTDNIYLGCNEEQARNLGLSSRKEIVGKRNADLHWKEQAPLLDELNLEVMRTGKPHEKEEDAWVGEELRTYLSKKVPLKGRNGEIKGIVGVSVDVTERKKMELALEKARYEAEETAKAKSEFLTNMSHDIRTPLVGMIGLSEYLHDQVRKKEHKEIAYQMIELSRNLLEVSNSLIEAAQAESGDFPVLEEVFSLKRLVDGIKALLKPTAEAKSLEFEVQQNPILPDYWIGDDKRIRRIIINLTSNAIKFTEKGFIKVTVDVTQAISRQQILKIKIQDSGPGIPKKKQGLIFKRFTKLSSAADAEYKGFGIGLNIVDQFIRDLKGTVELESEEGKGSTFTCSIPIKVPDPVVLSTLTVKEKSSDFYKNANLPKLKVLVIEDNKIASFSVRHLLEKFRFNVDLSENAEKGVQFHTQNRYDLIFTDLGLEDRDGYWIAQTIRDFEKNNSNVPPVVIIGLSAHVGKLEEKQCMESGMNQCLSKPLTQEKILEILKGYFSYETNNPVVSKKTESQDAPKVVKIIDLEKSAKEYYSGDLGAAKRMLDLLVKGLSNEQERMQAALDQKDWDIFYRLVHNFYGGCVSCGVPRLTKALGALKNALRKKTEEQEFGPLYEKVIMEMQALKKIYKDDFEADKP